MFFFVTAASPQPLACRRKVAAAGTVLVNVDKVMFILLFSDNMCYFLNPHELTIYLFIIIFYCY